MEAGACVVAGVVVDVVVAGWMVDVWRGDMTWGMR